MQRRTLLTMLAAAMLVLAGCGGTSPGDGSQASDGSMDGDTGETDGGDGTTTGDDGTDASDGSAGATGTVQFYVSDRPTAISEFEHLNVTITRIGFERAGGGDATAQNVTATPTAAETPAETATPANASAENDSTSQTDGTDEPEEGPPDDGGGDGGDGNDGDGGDGDDGERAGWVTREVDSRTVDLTRLQGDNATLVGTPEIPAGEYTKVFVYVERVDATLQDGSSATVKLPSGKLQLNKGFTLEPNGTVSFVYDISVVKAGKSGKYILKPVISQSGPDKPVEEVEGEDDEGGDGGPDASGDGETTGDGGDGGEEPGGSGESGGGNGGPPDDAPGGN